MRVRMIFEFDSSETDPALWDEGSEPTFEDYENIAHEANDDWFAGYDGYQGWRVEEIKEVS